MSLLVASCPAPTDQRCGIPHCPDTIEHQTHFDYLEQKNRPCQGPRRHYTLDRVQTVPSESWVQRLRYNISWRPPT
eukprot:scaffold60256_cov55-Attheya_sp.AAC.4